MADCVNACDSATIARSATASCQNPKRAVEDEDGGDRDSLDLVADRDRDGRCSYEQSDERVDQLVEREAKGGRLLARRGRFGP